MIANKRKKPLKSYWELAGNGLLPYGEATYEFERQLKKYAKLNDRLVEASLRRQYE